MVSLSLKKNTLLLFLVVILISWKNPANKKELIVGIPSLTMEQFETLKNSISSSTSVYYRGYCPKEQFLFLEYDESITNPRNVVEYIGQTLQINATNSIFTKDVNFAGAEAICNDAKIYLR